jgi:hypothetical protein
MWSASVAAMWCVMRLTVCSVSGPGALDVSTVAASTATTTTPSRTPPARTHTAAKQHSSTAIGASVGQEVQEGTVLVKIADAGSC